MRKGVITSNIILLNSVVSFINSEFCFNNIIIKSLSELYVHFKIKISILFKLRVEKTEALIHDTYIRSFKATH